MTGRSTTKKASPLRSKNKPIPTKEWGEQTSKKETKTSVKSKGNTIGVVTGKAGTAAAVQGKKTLRRRDIGQAVVEEAETSKAVDVGTPAAGKRLAKGKQTNTDKPAEAEQSEGGGTRKNVKSKRKKSDASNTEVAASNLVASPERRSNRIRIDERAETGQATKGQSTKADLGKKTLKNKRVAICRH